VIEIPGYVRNRGKRADGTTKWQARWRHPNDPSIREETFRVKSVADRWVTKMESDAHAGMYRSGATADRTFKVSSLTREVLKRYFARIEREGTSPGTLLKVHATLSSVFSEAIDLGIMATNPAAGALKGRAKAEQREMLFLDRDEIDALASAVPSFYRPLILPAAYTGLRAGELGGLRVRDLDLANGRVHVRQALKLIEAEDEAAPDGGGAVFGPPKSQKSRRTVPVPLFLRAILTEHLRTLPSPGGRVGRDPDALVFPAPNGKPMRHNLFYRRVFKPTVTGTKAVAARKVRNGQGWRPIPGRPAVAAALDPDKSGFRFHDLRHTYAALLISSGAHPKIVSEHMGHGSISITMDRYGHLYDDVHAATADALDAIWSKGREDDGPRLRAVE
jgi:integrase